MKTINISLPDIYLEVYPAEKNEINRHRIKSNRLEGKAGKLASQLKIYVIRIVILLHPF